MYFNFILSLHISVSIYCDEGWYDPNCETFCLQQHGDYFSCNQTTGNKECYPGKNCRFCNRNLQESHMHTHTRTHAHTRMYTHTHTHTHTYWANKKWSLLGVALILPYDSIMHSWLVTVKTINMLLEIYIPHIISQQFSSRILFHIFFMISTSDNVSSLHHVRYYIWKWAN